jgi:FkbM family methyltransferase
MDSHRRERPSVLSRVATTLPDKSFVRLVAWQYRFFEPELRHLRHLVPPYRTALDVGAWWGPWTWWLARRARLVHAFEPNVDVAAALTRVVLPNVRVHAQALSDTIGEAELSIPYGGRGTEGRASLLPRQGRPVTVPTVSLDSLDIPDIGFVKIDVEGHELAVLEGAARTLGRDRPNVLLEVEQQFHREGPSLQSVFEVLLDMDYVGTFLLKGKRQPLERFDVEVHQLRSLRQVQRSGLIRNMLFTSRHYVNNFAFFPRETL